MPGKPELAPRSADPARQPRPVIVTERDWRPRAPTNRAPTRRGRGQNHALGRLARISHFGHDIRATVWFSGSGHRSVILPPGLRYRLNMADPERDPDTPRRVGLRAFNKTKSFFNEHDMIFEKIDLESDIGIDAILTFARRGPGRRKVRQRSGQGRQDVQARNSH